MAEVEARLSEEEYKRYQELDTKFEKALAKERETDTPVMVRAVIAAIVCFGVGIFLGYMIWGA